MMNTATTLKRSSSGTRLFGVFTIQQDRERQTFKLRINFPRLLGVLTIAGLSLYTIVVVSGYVWLHKVRKLSEVTVWDVAFFKAGEVREKTGRKQFTTAKTAWKSGKYQEAYIAYYTGLRNAPDYLPGRLETADFLTAVGAANLAITVLEEGLQQPTKSEVLIKQTLDLLTKSGREQEALKLIRGPLAKDSSNRLLLRTYEIQAVYNTEGAKAAKQLLDESPEILHRVESAPVVVKVLWDSQERFVAIDALANYLKTSPKDYAGYALLVEFQEAMGNVLDARKTAELACQNLPGECAPRILKIVTLTLDPHAWEAELESYLREFRNRPEALAFLAEVAGKKGWVSLAQSLYENMANRSEDARLYAMYFSDALYQNNRRAEAMDVLLAIDRQTQDEASFSTALLQREIVVASSLGRREELIEYGQKLANLLSRDPERLETLRRRFVRLGLNDVAAALSGGHSKAQHVVAKK